MSVFRQMSKANVRLSCLIMKEEKDYYIENGFYVFTAKFLKKRGYCCDNGCRHCPYKNNEELGILQVPHS
jgi:hypothetical protein